MVQISIPSQPNPATFASQPSFTQKLVNFTFQLAGTPGAPQPTAFAGAPTGTPAILNVAGARARCRITNAGAPALGTADVSIYGLSQSTMNQIATLGVAGEGNLVNKNNIIISAGAASLPVASAANASFSPLTGFPVVFAGTIWFAYVDYNSMPEVALRITGQVGMAQAVIPVAPSSYAGPTSVQSIFQAFADALGVPLENNGVSGSLTNPYFPGTLMQQIYQAADHAHCQALLVDGGTKLALIPLGGSRTTLAKVPLISKNTGMIKAPAFAGGGFIAVEMVYNPDVVLFGNIQIETDNVPQANGPWTVRQLNLSLDSLVPGGDWKATAICYPEGLVAPPTPTVQLG